MLSLNARLLLAASAVLVCFLGLTGLALDRAFRDSAETALKDRLQGYIYALLAAADVQSDGALVLPAELPEGRLAQVGSGLYAQIVAQDGSEHWRSPSSIGVLVPPVEPLPPGTRLFSKSRDPEAAALYTLSFGVTYLGDGAPDRNYTFSVAEDLNSLRAQVQRFRRSLWGWLGAAAVVLLMVQGSILRWSLSPLRRAEQDLLAIERGQRDELQGPYPSELRGLTQNLNALLRNDRARVERYRQALSELAHSLKTPLAVLWSMPVEATSCKEMQAALQQQVSRMTQIVDYQLQRAAASGRATLAAPVAVGAAVRQIVDSLAKVYADKGVRSQIQIRPEVVFRGAEGDLLEVLGNVLDNAYKWCRQQVRVGAETVSGTASAQRDGVHLWIEDDGPGIPPARVEQILGRRVQNDGSSTGHGIGLRVAQDIIELYDGALDIGTSALGGARLEIYLAGK